VVTAQFCASRRPLQRTAAFEECRDLGGGEKKKTGRGKNGGKTVGAANRRYRRMSDLVGKGEKKEKGNKTESTWRRRTRLQLAFV